MTESCKRSNEETPTDPESGVEDCFDKLCVVVRSTAKTSLMESKLTERMVSHRTKDLFKKKRLLRKDKKDLKRVKVEIKESCLMDFKTWVNNTVVDIEKANKMGDVRKIVNLVNVLTKQHKPPRCNLIVDDDGKLLTHLKIRLRGAESSWSTRLRTLLLKFGDQTSRNYQNLRMGSPDKHLNLQSNISS